MHLALVIALALLGLACKSEKPRSGEGAAAVAGEGSAAGTTVEGRQEGTEGAAGGSEAGEGTEKEPEGTGETEKTTPKGAAYLEKLAPQLEEACRCQTIECFREKQAVLSADPYMDSELGPEDRKRHDVLQKRQAGCMGRILDPEVSKRMTKAREEMERNREEDLEALAIPYEGESAEGKDLIARSRSAIKPACDCTTQDCIDKLAEKPPSVDQKQRRALSRKEQEQWAKLMQAYTFCISAIVSRDYEAVFK